MKAGRALLEMDFEKAATMEAKALQNWVPFVTPVLKTKKLTEDIYDYW
jgi:hypothetical protein